MQKCERLNILELFLKKPLLAIWLSHDQRLGYYRGGILQFRPEDQWEPRDKVKMKD